jgi:formate-dependent phosphoribosylglycinamide formyltransferase (GAR transformylase)
MSKVLLVDTNFSSAPIYDQLIRLGNEVHVVGANPEDCLAKVSHNYWNVDYSDTQSLSELIKREGFDFIVPGCTDRSYESCSIVSNGKYPGIESNEVDQLINNKAAFRSLAGKLNLSIPQVQEYEADTLTWPIIVKPVDSFSGKGITALISQNKSELKAAIDKARAVSESGKFLIEEYVHGSLYSHSAFLQSGKVIQEFIVQENSTVNQFVVDTSRVVFEPPVNLLVPIRESVEKIARALSLKDGLLHTQFVFDGDRVWLIEITRRCPGDLYSQLIELSTGFEYVQEYLRPFLNLPAAQSPTRRFQSQIMRHTVTTATAQDFSHLRFKRELLIERWSPLSIVGEQLKPSPASRIAIIFAKADSARDLDDLYETTLKRDLYEIC